MCITVLLTLPVLYCCSPRLGSLCVEAEAASGLHDSEILLLSPLSMDDPSGSSTSVLLPSLNRSVHLPHLSCTAHFLTTYFYTKVATFTSVFSAPTKTRNCSNLTASPCAPSFGSS